MHSSKTLRRLLAPALAAAALAGVTFGAVEAAQAAAGWRVIGTASDHGEYPSAYAFGSADAAAGLRYRVTTGLRVKVTWSVHCFEGSRNVSRSGNFTARGARSGALPVTLRGGYCSASVGASATLLPGYKTPTGRIAVRVEAR